MAILAKLEPRLFIVWNDGYVYEMMDNPDDPEDGHMEPLGGFCPVDEWRGWQDRVH